MIKLSEVKKGIVKRKVPVSTSIISSCFVKEGTLDQKEGIVENFYVNVNMSIEEMNAIFEKINYDVNGERYRIMDEYGSYHSKLPAAICKIYDSDPDEPIGYELSSGVWDSFNGWDQDFLDEVNTNGGYIVIHKTMSDNYYGDPVGLQNDLLTSLFSYTPFENKEKIVTTEVSNWIELEEPVGPYKYSTTIEFKKVENIHNVTYDLINNNPVLFSECGFAIADVLYRTTKIVHDIHRYSNVTDAILTIYATKCPTEEVEFVIGVEV